MAPGKDAISGTKISTDELMFDSDMRGDFENFTIDFKEAQGMERSKIQLSVTLNGDLYQSSNITLAGNDGYMKKGDKIAGDTEILFHKVEGRDTEAGFKMQIKGEGVAIPGGSVDNINKAIELGEVNLGIVGPSHLEDDFGVSGTDNVSTNGALGSGSHLTGEMKIGNKVGKNSSQGTITFQLSTNVSIDEYLVVNGTKITFGQDIAIGSEAEKSMDNLLNYLNSSSDTNLSKAIYYVDDSATDPTIIIKAKAGGTAGNDFTLETNNIKSTLLNDASVASTSLGKDESMGPTAASGSITLGDNIKYDSSKISGSAKSL